MAVKSDQFVHLHFHSQYSLLDGACRIGDMVDKAKDLGQSSMAITDHGCLFGLVDFYSKATNAGVKPIIGIEAYMATGARTDRQAIPGKKQGAYNHLLLLAENNVGYHNLLKLSSIAYTEGFYYKPRIDKEVLKAHGEGIICTSACLGGDIPAALMADNRKRAKELAETYIDIFGPDRFFIEVQKHVPEQDQVNPELMDLADKLGLGLVATNDVHFLNKDDHAPHDALCCISTGRLLSDESRMVYPTELYMKSSQEMYDAMDHPKWREACSNTVRIADMCDVELDFTANHAPVVKIETAKKKKAGKKADEPAKGSTEWFKQYCSRFELLPVDSEDKSMSHDELKKYCDIALRDLSEAGLIWRYGEDGITQAHRDRLDRELGILADKDISAYFLIVWDFVNEARARGIPCNARGSGVGTMVGYVLGLSNACPIQYGLLFERFTDPDRSEYPDIDIDICQDGRQEIIDHVREKYGHVAQIITFGTLKARAAIRDVGRVLDVPLSEVDKVCKLIGNGLGVKLGEAVEQEPDLKKLYDESPAHRQMIDTAKRLEGLTRHAGVHAAGVIMATQPLDNIVPLYQPSGTDQVVTQWDGPTCEKIGLLKMDFLGLRTLSIIERGKLLTRQTLDEQTIRKTVRPDDPDSDKTWEPLDLERLHYDDQKVLDLFRRGETAGVFQFESGGFRNLLQSMKPDRLEDLIAANALYRPGPMELIPDYIDRKHGRQEVPKVHEIVDGFTEETHGIMIYQEQVMQIVHNLGGIPLRQAYTLIKAISKKKEKVINAQRPIFVEEAVKKGLTKEKAEELFDLILKFAGYGFNKSHSTGYAIVAYQTAYLKTYFPVQYMAAVLTYESVNTDKVVEYIDECSRVMLPNGTRGVEVRPPDINLSEIGFTVVFDKDEPHDANHGHIRFGISAVKGVGEKAINAIIEVRKKDGPFESLFDFAERVPLGTVNRATFEALIKCGAFDTLHGVEQRAAMMESLDDAISSGQQAAADRDAGQMNFFESMAAAEPEQAAAQQVTLAKVNPWSQMDRLKHEKGVLGFYVSSHPLDEHRKTLDQFASTTIADIADIAADVEVVIGGMLTRVRPTIVKNGRSAGQKMAMLTLADHTGNIDAVVFSKTYAIAAPLLENDKIVFFRGRVDRKREEPSIVVDEVIAAERAAEQLCRSVRIVLSDHQPDGRPRQFNGEFAGLKNLLRQSSMSNGGGAIAEVYIEIHQGGKAVTLRLNGVRIAVDQELPERINTVMQTPGCCHLHGPAKLNRQNLDSTQRYDAAGPRQEQLGFNSSVQEVCDSIDRY